MPTKLVRHRKSAYIAQSGRCYYCGSPMWDSNLESFSQAHNIKSSQAKWLKCTAEHLEARKDGGNDKAQNVVAACLFCNRTRHRRKEDLNPVAYRKLVQKRVRNGRWLCKSLAARLTS